MISSFSFLYLRSCAGDSDVVLQPELDVLLLQAAQPLEGVGDGVEGLDHLGLELGFDRGERERALHIVVVVEIAFGGGFAGILLLLVLVAVGLGLEGRGGRRRRRRRCGLHHLQVRRAAVAGAVGARRLPSPFACGACLASGPA